jgi:hypothetical protein
MHVLQVMLVWLRSVNHQGHFYRRITRLVGCISASVGGIANSYVLPYADSFKTLSFIAIGRIEGKFTCRRMYIFGSISAA